MPCCSERSAHLRTTRASLVATANPGCHLQIARGLRDAGAVDGRRASGVAAGARLQTRRIDPMKRIIVDTPGGPEMMKVVEAQKPGPGPKEAVVKIAYSGVNFIDVYFRTGLYKADAPIVLGSEAAGTVESVGPDVTEVAPGDRVAYAMVRGSYAEYAVVPAAQLVKIPDDVDFATAAAVMLQGTTAHYLTHSTFPLKAGRHLPGARRRGRHRRARRADGQARSARASSAPCRRTTKARLARELGADETINYTTQDFEAEVKRLTNGRGVDVVYDSVGKTTFDKSLDRAAAARHDGALRPVERLGAALRSRHPQRARARCSSPAPAWATICSTVRNCCGASATCSATSRRERSRCGFLARSR